MYKRSSKQRVPVVGALVGKGEGAKDGLREGAGEGAREGAYVGSGEGFADGFWVGEGDGLFVGVYVGARGAVEGARVGCSDGTAAAEGAIVR